MGSFTTGGKAASVAASCVKNTQTITGTTMTLPDTPLFIFEVSMNGQVLTLTTDYSITGPNITFVSTMASDSITVVYIK